MSIESAQKRVEAARRELERVEFSLELEKHGVCYHWLLVSCKKCMTTSEIMVGDVKGEDVKVRERAEEVEECCGVMPMVRIIPVS